jgi:hypothetical protein
MAEDRMILAGSEWSEQLIERLVRMEANIEQIKRCLWGNGQPGRCAREDERIHALNSRVQQLENQVTYHRAIVVVVSAVVGSLTSVAWLFLTWLRK